MQDNGVKDDSPRDGELFDPCLFKEFVMKLELLYCKVSTEPS
jgi:hypothetical protein